MDNLVEIRILGTFSVRRGDGTTVAPRAWRTSKTRSLVRMLALHADAPVPTDRVVEALWPDVGATKGRGSLRMAVSQIRQVIGKDCVVRQFDGLVLQHAWVDAVAFSSLAAEARRLFARGQLAEGVAAAREATALYGGDLCADEPYAEWAFADREALRALRVTVLAEAAEAAVWLGRHRLAIEMAEQLVAGEPAHERAYRVLMRAHAGLGETDRALGAYERCRTALVEAFGADPSHETRALHAELLSIDPTDDMGGAFVGRDAEMQTIRAHVSEGLREGQPTLVVISGEQGSGRTRLADEACAPWSDRLVTIQPFDSEPPAGEAIAAAVAATAPLVVRLDELDEADAATLTTLRDILTRGSCPVAIVATADDLLSQLLTERAGPAFLEQVTTETRGYPGQIVQLIGDLSTAGQLTVTRNGVERLAAEATGADDAEGVVQRVRAGLAPSEAAVFDFVSVLESPFTRGDVAAICGRPADEVGVVLDRLVEEGLLTGTGDHYRFREAGVADAAYRWLRPSVRRELHETVAASPGVPEAARVEHWDAAGKPALASAAALQAAADAAAQGDCECQRAHAVRARGLLDPATADPRDRLAAAESLGDACYGLERFAEARTALEEAMALAQTHAPGEIARLSRKLAAVAEPRAHGEALGRYRQALTEPSDDPMERVRTMSAIGSMLALRSPVAATDVLRNAVGMADEVGDVAAQVEARVVLATHAHAPMRSFAECEQGVREALALADAGGDDAVLAQGLLASKQATVALGSAWQTVATLTRAEDLAGRAGEPRLAGDAKLLLALTAHELGASDFAGRWATSWEQAPRVPSAGIWRWVPGRVLYERGHLAHAGEVLAPSLRGGHGALDFQMVRLCAARLAAERGNVDEAIELLTVAADFAVDTGVTVVLPEVAARLAVLEARRDPAAAAARLDQAEAALGESVFAREQTAIMLGRAALLAARGQPQAAADMAGAAGVASRGAGLVFGHAEALTTQAGYLTAAGDHARALAVLRRAGEQYACADAPARLRATSDLAARLGLDWEIGVGAR